MQLLFSYPPLIYNALINKKNKKTKLNSDFIELSKKIIKSDFTSLVACT